VSTKLLNINFSVQSFYSNKQWIYLLTIQIINQQYIHQINNWEAKGSKKHIFLNKFLTLKICSLWILSKSPNSYRWKKWNRIKLDFSLNEILKTQVSLSFLSLNFYKKNIDGGLVFDMSIFSWFIHCILDLSFMASFHSNVSSCTMYCFHWESQNASEVQLIPINNE